VCVCYPDTSRYVDDDNVDDDNDDDDDDAADAAAAVARLAPFFVGCSNRNARPFAISQCKYVE